MLKAVRLNSTTYPTGPEEYAEMARAGAELIEIEGQTPEEIIAGAEDCDALLVVSSKVPLSVISRLTKCRVIARMGAGTDKIDIDAATERGILVTNVPDFCLNEQAEHTMTLLLSFARRLPYMMQSMAQFHWTARSHPGVHRIAGRTLGLVGLGASAQVVARRAAAFDLKVQAWVRNPAKYQEIADQLQVSLVPLEILMAGSDFISIHLPLTPSTHHLLSAELLGLMKPTAVLINTARGAIVDEAALIKLLQDEKIAGAALDVFEGIDVFAMPGTPADSPLLNLDNVILTPHCAGSSVESSLESKIRGARNAADVLLGIWPRHVVNPEVEPRVPLRAQ